MGVLIFTGALIIFILYNQNNDVSDSRVFETLIEDSEHIAAGLLSAGTPPDWNETTVETAGISDGHQRLNLTKLGRLMNLSAQARNRVLSTNANYLIYLKDGQGILNLSGCALSNTAITPETLDEQHCKDLTPDADQLVSSERLLFHNGTIIRLVVQTWT